MKLYSYSFGVIALNQSVDHALGSHSAKTLAAENNVLRKQFSLISPRISQLEMQARQLTDRANTLFWGIPYTVQ
jgi:hypothetical protein